MLAALDWQSVLVGAAGTIILIGGVLAALGQIGRAWSWLMQRFRPEPPRLELESAGGSHSQERDEATKEITWINVKPGFTVRNNELVSLYAVTAGVVDPAGAAQIAHPQQVPVLKAETPVPVRQHRQLPDPLGLAGRVRWRRSAPGVPYFVEVMDSRDRRWGIIAFAFREEAPRLRFRRVRR